MDSLVDELGEFRQIDYEKFDHDLTDTVPMKADDAANDVGGLLVRQRIIYEATDPLVI